MHAPESEIWHAIRRLHRAQASGPSEQLTLAGQRHCIVLAGGRGARLAHVTQERTGTPIPKQFCSFADGQGTLLQETTRRLESMVDGTTRVVVCRDHAHVARSQLSEPLESRLVVQPTDRGTALGLLFGLIELLVETPDARVLAVPSDHGFDDESVLERTVDAAFDAIVSDDERIILITADAHHAATDLGWVLTRTDDDLAPVDGFVEKPEPRLAQQLFELRAAWSTMMMVATGRALLDLFVRRAPLLVRLLLRHAELPRDERGPYLERTYGSLPHIDLAQDVLRRDDRLWGLRLPATAGWTDLGTEERLREWQANQDRSPRKSEVRRLRPTADESKDRGAV